MRKKEKIPYAAVIIIAMTLCILFIIFIIFRDSQDNTDLIEGSYKVEQENIQENTKALEKTKATPKVVLQNQGQKQSKSDEVTEYSETQKAQDMEDGFDRLKKMLQH